MFLWENNLKNLWQSATYPAKDFLQMFTVYLEYQTLSNSLVE